MASNGTPIKPPTMQSGGRYSENQPASGDRFVRPLEPFLRKAVHAVAQSFRDGPFTLCDFGAADGEMTMLISDVVIDELHSLSTNNAERQVNIVCEDQAENDFGALFRRAEQHYGHHKNVFIQAIGRSFYLQCMPSRSVHFGTCCLSAHWLNPDYSPGGYQPIDCGLLCRQAEGKLSPVDEARLDALRHKAAVDWEVFLTQRAEELAVGGYFVLPHNLRSSVKDSPEALDREITDKVTALLPKAAIALRDQGDLRPEEVKRITFPQMIRNEEQLLAPFIDPSSSVSRAGLHLKSFSKITVSCPIRELYLSGEIDKKEHFRRLELSLRSWSEGLVSSALREDRSVDEAARLVDKVYNTVRQMLEAGGYDDAALSYPMMVLVMKKATKGSPRPENESHERTVKTCVHPAAADPHQ